MIIFNLLKQNQPGGRGEANNNKEEKENLFLTPCSQVRWLVRIETASPTGTSSLSSSFPFLNFCLLSSLFFFLPVDERITSKTIFHYIQLMGPNKQKASRKKLPPHQNLKRDIVEL